LRTGGRTDPRRREAGRRARRPAGRRVSSGVPGRVELGVRRRPGGGLQRGAFIVRTPTPGAPTVPIRPRRRAGPHRGGLCFARAKGPGGRPPAVDAGRPGGGRSPRVRGTRSADGGSGTGEARGRGAEL